MDGWKEGERVSERERETDRDRERKRDGETERVDVADVSADK